MGTRANIIIRENNTEKILYSHYDGYIVDGVGDMLEEFIWNFVGSRSDSTRPISEQFEFRLTNKWHPNPETFELKKTDCIHGDIEYLYIIDINEGIPSLKAYSRHSDEAWENGPEDYLNSWNFVDIINPDDYAKES